MSEWKLKDIPEFCKELRVTRTASRISRGTTADEVEFIARHSPRHLGCSIQAPQTGLHKQQQESSLLQPLVMQFNIMLQVCMYELLVLDINQLNTTAAGAVGTPPSYFLCSVPLSLEEELLFPVEDTDFYGMWYCSDSQTATDVLEESVVSLFRVKEFEEKKPHWKNTFLLILIGGCSKSVGVHTL